MTPRRAQPVRLSPDASASEAFLVIVGECIDHWRANEAGVVEDRAPEALHQLRVGVRRFRSAFSLFSRVIDDPQIPWLRAEIRGLALPLGVGRDLDVFLSSDLADELTANQLEVVRQRRESAYDNAAVLLDSSEWNDVWRLVDRFLAHAPWSLDPDPPAQRAARRILERQWQRVTRRGALLADLSPTDRHRVRIQGKKLRYGVQFFTDLFPEPVGTPPTEFAKTMGQLQDTLGTLNDVHTEELFLASVGAPTPKVDHDALLTAALDAMSAVNAMTPFWTKPKMR